MDVAAHRQHQCNVVLDQQHATADFVLDAADQLHKVLGFLRRHTRCRLVQQQVFGLHHERTANRHTPFVGIGQGTGHTFSQMTDADPLQHFSAFAAAARRVSPKPTPVTSRLSMTARSETTA